MTSSIAVAHKLYRILSKTSREMRSIVSRDPQADVEFSYMQDSKSDIEEYPTDEFDFTETEPNYFDAANSSEVDLSDDIFDQLDYIVICRCQIFSLLSNIPPEDRRADLKRSLLRRVEELETRAVIFLTLPPQALNTDQSCPSAEDDIQTHFDRFLSDAENYLNQATDLLENRAPEHNRSSDVEHVHDKVSDVSERPFDIAGFSLREASEITTEVEDSIFSLLSNPHLRSNTALVKMIVGLACSQITGNDPEHCLNRLNYLLTFFEGSPVRPPGVTCRNASDPDGGNAFSLRSLPADLGSKYAWHCLITAALGQASHQFAYSLDSTLPFAAVLATLLARYPDQVPHFLSRVVLACPPLSSFAEDDLPLSSPDVTNPDEKDLLNWRGVSRLFAAVLLAKTPPGFLGRPHTLNPKFLWLVIAGLVRRPFIRLTTAQVLLGLIEIGGFVLLRVYGRQANRLFASIIHIINRSSELAQSAPELALVNCIEIGLREGRFPSEFGILPESFWS